MQRLLTIDGVGLYYEDRTILEGISFTLDAGQITTLIGPNGAGKTSLIRIILGLQKASSGTIEIARQARIGYMPQRLTIDPSLPLSVLSFLQLAQRDKDLCRQALEQADIPHLSKSPMAHLSGGETQRVLLARAVLRKPQLLILDEPGQGLDISGQESLYRHIGQIRDKTGCGILLVSHDLHLVMAATDDVLCLNRHICCYGSPERVSSDPVFRELFGGRTALYTHHHDHEHDLHGAIDASEEAL